MRGSAVAISDENGSVTDRFEYGPYGELLNHTGASDTPFLYNGRDGVMVDDNGLYYMRARYYSPEIKRFLSEDTFKGKYDDLLRTNLFEYVNGNPISHIDPNGKWKSKAEQNWAYKSWDSKDYNEMWHLGDRWRKETKNRKAIEARANKIRRKYSERTSEVKKPVPQPRTASSSNNTTSLGYWLDPKLQIAGNGNFGAKDFGGSVTLVNGHIVVHGQTGAAIPTDMRDLPVNGAVKVGPIWGINVKGDLSGLSGSGTYAPNRFGTTIVTSQNAKGQSILGVQPTFGSKQVSVSIDYSKELYDIDLNPFD